LDASDIQWCKYLTVCRLVPISQSVINQSIYLSTEKTTNITKKASTHKSAKTHAGTGLWLVTSELRLQNNWISRTHRGTCVCYVWRS